MDQNEIDRLTKELHFKVLYIKEVDDKLARIKRILEVPARSRRVMQAAIPARKVLNIIKEDSVAAVMRQLQYDYSNGCVKAREFFPD